MKIVNSCTALPFKKKPPYDRSYITAKRRVRSWETRGKMKLLLARIAWRAAVIPRFVTVNEVPELLIAPPLPDTLLASVNVILLIEVVSPALTENILTALLPLIVRRFMPGPLRTPKGPV
jgi:hypothetical protein